MTLKSRGKDYIRKIVVKSHVLDLAGHFASPSAVILMYHSVRDDPRQHSDLISPDITHATSIFSRQMEIVAREFAPVTLDNILLFLRGGAPLPRRAVAITFDDGFADNAETAAPILDRFGIRGAFYATVDLIGTLKAPWYCRLRYAFLTTRRTQWTDAISGHTLNLRDPGSREAALQVAFDRCAPMVAYTQEEFVRGIESTLEVKGHTVDRPVMMNWDQIRSLRSSGHTVGSHTLTHPNVAHVTDDKSLHRELAESKRRIEDELGAEVIHFSYPHPALNPQWNEKTVKATGLAGYKSAVTTTVGRVPQSADPLCLRRVRAPLPENRFRSALSCTFLGLRDRYPKFGF